MSVYIYARWFRRGILRAHVEVEYYVCLRCIQEARGAVILVEMPTTYDNCRAWLATEP